MREVTSLKEEINLYLDDLRDCPEGFVLARNIEEAIYYLENYTVRIMTLDHDLGEDDAGNLLPTGYDLVKLFCERGYYASKIYLHTDNGVGRENMYHTLKGAQRRGFISEDIEVYHYPITKNKYSGE